MSDAIKTKLIIKVYAHCILHEAALQISQQAGKKHRFHWFKNQTLWMHKNKNNRHVHSTFWC